MHVTGFWKQIRLLASAWVKLHKAISTDVVQRGPNSLADRLILVHLQTSEHVYETITASSCQLLTNERETMNTYERCCERTCDCTSSDEWNLLQQPRHMHWYTVLRSLLPVSCIPSTSHHWHYDVTTAPFWKNDWKFNGVAANRLDYTVHKYYWK